VPDVPYAFVPIGLGAFHRGKADGKAWSPRMTHDSVPARRQVTTFIVRLSREDGRLTGVIERVRSGEKAHVDSRAIGRMIDADATKGTA
jgi:hypothetical protein